MQDKSTIKQLERELDCVWRELQHTRLCLASVLNTDSVQVSNKTLSQMRILKIEKSAGPSRGLSKSGSMRESFT